MKKPITILIADDNSFMREGLRMIISTMRTVELVGEATNGEEAIQLARELSPDIILMDINMSPVNGFEATQKIMTENPAAKIIGVSDNKGASYVRKMMSLGAKGYVIKGSFTGITEAIEEVAAGKIYIDKDIEGKI